MRERVEERASENTHTHTHTHTYYSCMYDDLAAHVHPHKYTDECLLDYMSLGTL